MDGWILLYQLIQRKKMDYQSIRYAMIIDQSTQYMYLHVTLCCQNT